MKRVSRAMIERYLRRYRHHSTVIAAIKAETGVTIGHKRVAAVERVMSWPRVVVREPIADTKVSLHEDMMQRGCDELLQALVREHPYAFQAIPAVVPEFSNTDLRCLFPVRSSSGIFAA